MKFKLQLSILTCIILSTMASSYAQSYNNAAGVRAGASNGITYKHFLSESNAMELIATTRWRGFQLAGLYEKHQPVAGSKAFNFYYGLGGHAGFWNTYDDHPWFDDNTNSNNVVIGVDGILGLEYTFGSIPFALSLDWKPEFNIINYTGFWAGDAGLSIRYYW